MNYRVFSTPALEVLNKMYEEECLGTFKESVNDFSFNTIVFNLQIFSELLLKVIKNFRIMNRECLDSFRG